MRAIKDILCVTAVGIGSAMVGWSIGMGRKCDICAESSFCSDCRYRLAEYDYPEIYEDEDTINQDGDILTPSEYALEYETYKHAVAEYNRSESEPLRPVIEEVPTGDPDIFVISYNEWCEADEDEYKKDTIVYYEEDQIVCDMHDSSIRDYTDLVGGDALEMFGIMSHDPDVVYIRNKRMMIDFEFVREHSSYRQSVLGLSEEAEEMADAKVQEALDYFQARSIEEIDPAALAKYHTEREDE